jgi:hypothetical protein
LPSQIGTVPRVILDKLELRSLYNGIVCSLIVCGCAITPSPARAGTYKMFSCQPPGVNVASPTSGPWRVYSVNSPNTLDRSNCGAGPSGAMMLAFNGNEMPSFGHAGWELPAAALNANVGIVRVKSWARTETESPPQCGFCFQVLFGENLGPTAAVYPRSADPAEGYTSPTADPPAGAHRLGLQCGDGGAGAPCKVINSPNLVIAGLETDLFENVAPDGAITGGSLASPGTKAGPASLSYTASDAQSGIQRVEALIGDAIVGAQDFSRNLTLALAQQTGECTYTGLAACPASQSRDVSVDTTAVPNGSYAVRLRIIDAAGNRKDVPGPLVTIANGSVPGAPNGAPASRSAKLTARFTTTSKRARRLPYRSRPAIKGRLVNERKQPIAGATVAVLVRATHAGARTEQVDTVRTTSNGTFAYRLRPGPSRRVTFAYTAFADDAKPAASSALRTEVRAIVSLTAAPRSPRAGQLLTLSGRLRLLPRAGVEVKIQPRQGRRWYTFGTVKTTKGGHFRWHYRFAPSKRGSSFAFRARVDSPIYPFAAGNSPAILIHVR